MRARLHDPVGPWWARAVLPAIGGTCVASGIYGDIRFGGPLSFGFFVGMSILLLAPLLLGRNRPRVVDLVLRGGRVDVQRAGWLGQPLRSKSITAASTARTDEGVSLALMCEGRRSPFLFELEADGDAEKIRDALGIGHGGIGALVWERERRLIDLAALVMRVLGAEMWIVLGIMAQAENPLPLGAPVAVLAVLSVLVLVKARTSGSRRCTLGISERGVEIGGRGPTNVVPFAAIEAAQRSDSGIELTLAGPNTGKNEPRSVRIPITTQSHLRSGMTPADVSHALAQVRSGAARAHGAGVPRVGVSEHLETIRRGTDTTRGWLTRIDALAERIKIAQAGYRDATLDAEDLRAALHDHDCDPELRSAAARILVRVDPDVARTEVTEIAAAVRDPDEARLLRVAILPDVDEVARDIDALPEKVMRR